MTYFDLTFTFTFTLRHVNVNQQFLGAISHLLFNVRQMMTTTMTKTTLDCLKKNVPGEVPGVAFLSGGQSEIESSKNLNEINKINDSKFLITFSYGRGLQASALKEFGKNQANLENIQKAFNHRAKMNGLSSKGEWSEDLEKEFAA